MQRPPELSVDRRYPPCQDDSRRGVHGRRAVERIRGRVFARSWQIAADRTEVRTPRRARPFTFLEGLIAEPLLLTRDDGDRLRCMSNRGRYSPTREQGVHHFHRLLVEHL